MSGLGTRIATALILVSVFLSLLWIPILAPLFYAFVLVLAGVGLVEFVALVRHNDSVNIKHLLIFGFTIFCYQYDGTLAELNALTVAASILTVFLLIITSNATITSLLGTVGGFVYVMWTASHVNLLFGIPDVGRGLVMAMVVAVAVTDVGAYFVGKSIGAHKLAPVVSPNKTWEGAIGGFVVAGIGMAVLWQLRSSLEWTSYPDWSLWIYVGVGAVLSVAGQVGDLFQSALKRDAGVKDSGNIFPGHGGILDRCDGFLFAAPVLYYFVEFLG
ncbi:MAG: phosphatidate cytidylyltransferase [Candidatus Hydrogenedentota bacterium]